MKLAPVLRRPAVLACALSVFLFSCAGPTSPPAATALPTTRPTGTALSAQSAEGYRQMVDHLASPAMEGRGAGTRGLDLARDYLAGQFRAAGLVPACGGTYLQPFQVSLGLAVQQEGLAVLDRAGRTVAAGLAGKDFAALGFSGSGEFDAPAVFVGYGVVNPERNYDSYAGAGEALKGKVAVAFRYEPQEAGKSLWESQGGWSPSSDLSAKAAWAARHGAAALLVVNPAPQVNEPLRTARETARADRAPASIPVMHITVELFKRVLAAAGLDADATLDKLQRQADAGEGGAFAPGGIRLRGAVRMALRQAPVSNVVGLLPGSGGLGEQVVIVGAHYDHVGYVEKPPAGTQPATQPTTQRTVYAGADDNASGAAGVVLLARRLAAASATQPWAKRTVLFVTFAGEERGLLGSRHLADHLGEVNLRREQIVAMINLDMIGRLRNNRLLIWGAESGDRWGEVLKEAARPAGLTALPTGSANSPSDQVTFYRMKVPTVTFHTGMHTDVHRPGDTPDKINAAGAVAVLDVVQAVVSRLRSEPRTVAYVPPKTTTSAASRPGGAYLGIVPDPYGGDAGGCALTEVIPGGPADAAGLKPGDIIIRFNDQRIADSPALLAALARCRPADVVKLQFLRQGKTLSAQVKLAQR